MGTQVRAERGKKAVPSTPLRFGRDDNIKVCAGQKKKPWVPIQGFYGCGSCDVLVFVACVREEFG
jgi:hypothetical protein